MLLVSLKPYVTHYRFVQDDGIWFNVEVVGDSGCLRQLKIHTGPRISSQFYQAGCWPVGIQGCLPGLQILDVTVAPSFLCSNVQWFSGRQALQNLRVTCPALVKLVLSATGDFGNIYNAQDAAQWAAQVSIFATLDNSLQDMVVHTTSDGSHWRFDKKIFKLLDEALRSAAAKVLPHTKVHMATTEGSLPPEEEEYSEEHY